MKSISRATIEGVQISRQAIHIAQDFLLAHLYDKGLGPMIYTVRPYISQMRSKSQLKSGVLAPSQMPWHKESEMRVINSGGYMN